MLGLHALQGFFDSISTHVSLSYLESLQFSCSISTSLDFFFDNYNVIKIIGQSLYDLSNDHPIRDLC